MSNLCCALQCFPFSLSCLRPYVVGTLNELKFCLHIFNIVLTHISFYNEYISAIVSTHLMLTSFPRCLFPHPTLIYMGVVGEIKNRKIINLITFIHHLVFYPTLIYMRMRWKEIQQGKLIELITPQPSLIHPSIIVA